MDKIYNDNFSISEVIYSGEIEGTNYEWYIKSIEGSHPCAYISVDKDCKYYKKDLEYELEDIVHGGITYCNPYLEGVCERKDEKWVFGWDYAHTGDYTRDSFPMGDFMSFTGKDEDWGNQGGKKWSKEEILKDIYRLAKWLNED